VNNERTKQARTSKNEKEDAEYGGYVQESAWRKVDKEERGKRKRKWKMYK
jgi:hypothetical protein